jgi:hypothetical protein
VSGEVSEREQFFLEASLLKLKNIYRKWQVRTMREQFYLKASLQKFKNMYVRWQVKNQRENSST